MSGEQMFDFTRTIKKVNGIEYTDKDGNLLYRVSLDLSCGHTVDAASHFSYKAGSVWKFCKQCNGAA